MDTFIKSIRGFGWVSIGQGLSTAMRILGTIYLARIIDPFFFGQKIMAVAVVSIFGAFYMIGVQPAIIRQQKQIKSYIETVLFIRTSMVFILCAVLLGLWALNILPNSQEIQFYIILLFASQSLAEITSVYAAYITREMFFFRLMLLHIIPVFIGTSVACVLAARGYTIWALLWLTMAENLTTAILSFLLVPKLFRPKFNRKLAFEFFHYAKYIVITNFLERFRGQIDRLFIGAFSGLTSLGFYQRASGLSGQIQQVTMGGISVIAQPYFSKLQGDRERLGRSIEFLSSLLVRVSCFIFIGFAFILPDVVSFVYTDKWLPAVPIFRLLLPLAVLRGLRIVLRNTHTVAGSVNRLVVSQFFELLVLGLLLYPLIYWKKVSGAVIAVNISTITGVGFMLYYMRNFANFNIWRIFAAPIIAGSSGFLVVLAVSAATGKTIDNNNVWVNCLLFSIIYWTILVMLEYSFIREVLGLIKRAIKQGG